MALEPNDVSMAAPPPPVVPAAYRFRKAILTVFVPTVDANGNATGGKEVALEYEDPRLTDQQRAQFINTAKFIMRTGGEIA